jgi:hypothetical protein
MALKLHATSRSIWRTAFLVAALAVLAGTAVPDGACAEGLFDFADDGIDAEASRHFQRSAAHEAFRACRGSACASVTGLDAARPQQRLHFFAGGRAGRQCP